MNCDSPLRKKQKYTESVMSFEDIQSDLYHLVAMKKQVKTLVCNMYKSEFSHKMKYLQNVEVEPHNVAHKDIPEVSDKFLQNNAENQEKCYEELSGKLERHHLLMQILEKKDCCKISKMVDSI